MTRYVFITGGVVSSLGKGIAAAPTFGSSIYVWGAIITIFMLALSIGYLIGGRLSMSVPHIRVLCGLHFLSGVLLLPSARCTLVRCISKKIVNDPPSMTRK